MGDADFDVVLQVEGKNLLWRCFGRIFTPFRCRKIHRTTAIAVSCLVLTVVALTTYSWIEGDAQRLLLGVDVGGHFCTGDAPFAFFPKPTNTTLVALCLPGCPLVHVEEVICGEDSQFECFDAYPSKPVFGHFCLPADRERRNVVLQHLYSSEMVFTRIAGDVLKTVFGGDIRAFFFLFLIGLSELLIFLGVMKLSLQSKRGFLWTYYYLNLFVLPAEMYAICRGIYDESAKGNETLCAAQPPVQMEDCDESERFAWSHALCWVLVAVFAVAFNFICRDGHIKHRGLFGIHESILKVDPLWKMIVVTIAWYFIGACGICYLLSGFIFLASCLSDSEENLDNAYHSAITQPVFDLWTRTVAPLVLVVLFICIFLVESVVKIVAADFISIEPQPDDADNGLQKERIKQMRERVDAAFSLGLRVVYLFRSSLVLSLPAIAFAIGNEEASSALPLACCGLALAILLQGIVAGVLRAAVCAALNGTIPEDKLIELARICTPAADWREPGPLRVGEVIRREGAQH